MNRRWSRFALRALLSAGLFALLLSRVRWPDLAALLRDVRPFPLALGSCLIAVCPLLIAARTRLMLGQWGIAMRYPAALSLTWVGQFCNAFLPGSTGGDAVKFYRIWRAVPDRKAAGFAALFADRLMALLALALLAGAALVFGDRQLVREVVTGSSSPISVRTWISVAAAALAAGLLVLAFVCGLRFPGRRRKPPVVNEVGMALRAGPKLSGRDSPARSGVLWNTAFRAPVASPPDSKGPARRAIPTSFATGGLRRLPGNLKPDTLRRARELAATLQAGFRLRPALGAALLLALAVHLMALASCYQFCRALQIPASFGQIMLVWPVTTLAVLLPLTVNGHGLREYILLFYFRRWHLVSGLNTGSSILDTVLALSLLMVAADFLWSLPGGLCLLIGSRASSPSVPVAAAGLQFGSSGP
jgi:uncharacterized membrane protein YbhN (UPF0104 family)